jgi:predicted transcriptional regulator
VESLDELASEMDRDRSYLLNEAVEYYLRLNEHHIKLIKKGLRAAERGDFVPDAELKELHIEKNEVHILAVLNAAREWPEEFE